MNLWGETQFADTEDGCVAYKVFGNGPLNMVFVTDWTNNVEVMWEEPRIERFYGELASFCCVAVFDNRGGGVSDPVPDLRMSAIPGVEVAMEDIKAVMDAVGFEQAVIVSIGVGCWSSLLLAATSPERVQRLMIVDGLPCLYSEDGTDKVGLSRKEADRFVDWLIDVYGSGKLLKLLDPKAFQDKHFCNWYARYERLCIAPKLVKAFWTSSSQINLMSALPAITAPTLVMSRAESRAYPVRWGRSLADGIRSAEFVEVSSGDELYFMSSPNPIIEYARSFLAGAQEVVEVDRVLATILFTDLVGSTEKVVEMGDSIWRDQLLRHHALVRRELDRFRGKEIDTAGDGFLATFDGPARAIRCARAIRQAIESLGLDIRIGIHSGECELVGEKLGGIAVHTASRVMATANAGEILVSRTVKDLVAGSGLSFKDRGLHTFKGVPDEWRLFLLQDISLSY